MQTNVAEEFDKLKDMERNYASELRIIGETILSPIFSILITAISKDSEKHALIFESLKKY